MFALSWEKPHDAIPCADEFQSDDALSSVRSNAERDENIRSEGSSSGIKIEPERGSSAGAGFSFGIKVESGQQESPVVKVEPDEGESLLGLASSSSINVQPKEGGSAAAAVEEGGTADQLRDASARVVKVELFEVDESGLICDQELADIKNIDENQPCSNVHHFKITEFSSYLSRPSTSSSSSSPSSGSSCSSNSDTESWDEQNNEQVNYIQVTTEKVSDEKQSERTSIGETATSEVSGRNHGDALPIEEQMETNQRGRKRKRHKENWKENKTKKLKNTGKQYTTTKHKTVQPRSVKTTCAVKCKFKCCEKVTADQRQIIFEAYRKLGQINAQRSFLLSCMPDITPKYKCPNVSVRKKCKAFHVIVEGISVRVCKKFFMRTLDISDNFIRTVKYNTDEDGFILNDLRGQHNNNVDEAILTDIKQFIEAIPRIESHYVRQRTTREYIDGGKKITGLFKDFKEAQEKYNKPAGKFGTFYKVFRREYNISFCRSKKKDECDLCLQYNNSKPEQKVSLQESYDGHLEEKILSRQEKQKDRCNIDDKNKVIVFDLQAILQSPRGSTSEFYCKSKLNSYNFTVTFLNGKHSYDDVHCFLWNETDAKCGANEIGSCLLKIFDNLSAESPHGNGYINLVLYSDDCCGQNKNEFLVVLYLYAVTHLNIESITHKYLIEGHTQNEVDDIHNVIEKEVAKNLRSGPIYSPHHYIDIIKNAKRYHKKIFLHELTFESFIDIKKLQEHWGSNFTKTEKGSTVLWKDVKVIRVEKNAPFSFFVKTSYKDKEYQEVCIRHDKQKVLPPSKIVPTSAYAEKQDLREDIKKDLRELLSNNLIPSSYSDFYKSII